MKGKLHLRGDEELRVLLVDDMAEIRAILARFFREAGPSRIEEAGEGLEAIEKALAFRPHLIMCDLNMPVMNGAEFLGFVESCPTLADTRVILLTTESEEAAELTARALPVEAAVQKPFHAGTLSLVLDHLVTRT